MAYWSDTSGVPNFVQWFPLAITPASFGTFIAQPAEAFWRTRVELQRSAPAFLGGSQFAARPPRQVRRQVRAPRRGPRSILQGIAGTGANFLIPMPPGGMFHGAKLVPNAQFAGGSTTNVTLSLGIVGNVTLYGTAIAVGAGVSLGSVNMWKLNIPDCQSQNASWNLALAIASNTGLSALTSGSATLFLAVAVAA